MQNKVFHKRAILLSFQAEFTECVLDILHHPESIIMPIMAGPGEKFQNEGSRMAGKWYFETDFLQNKVFHKRAILLSCQAEFSESMLEILSYLECTIKPTVVG